MNIPRAVLPAREGPKSHCFSSNKMPDRIRKQLVTPPAIELEFKLVEVRGRSKPEAAAAPAVPDYYSGVVIA